MNHTSQVETMALAEQADRLCEGMSEAEEKTARELVDCISSKWSLWILHELAQEGAPLRFSRISERVEGVSQKVLTQTLRQLERDGLITRTLYPQVPPRVEYELAPLGGDLLAQLLPFWGWVMSHVADFEAARQSFDEAAQRARARAAR